MSLRILFAGTPEFALPALDALAASEHALLGILTQPDRAAGRGRRTQASPVKQRALALSLPAFEGRDMVIGVTYIVVIFSLLVQATTLGALVRRCSGSLTTA